MITINKTTLNKNKKINKRIIIKENLRVDASKKGWPCLSYG